MANGNYDHIRAIAEVETASGDHLRIQANDETKNLSIVRRWTQKDGTEKFNSKLNGLRPSDLRGLANAILQAIPAVPPPVPQTAAPQTAAASKPAAKRGRPSNESRIKNLEDGIQAILAKLGS